MSFMFVAPIRLQAIRTLHAGSGDNFAIYHNKMQANDAHKNENIIFKIWVVCLLRKPWKDIKDENIPPGT